MYTGFHSMFYGKVIGGILGFASFGFIGALIGIGVGHYFDKALAANFQMPSPEQQAQLREQFFQTVFTLMGHLAKADGRVSEQEIAATQALMQRMGLTAEHRQQAIQLFKQGSAAEFELAAALTTFVTSAGRYPQLNITLLEYLTVVAIADGELHDAERNILFAVAEALGIGRWQFEKLLGMLLAQEQFREQQFRDQEQFGQQNYSQQDYSQQQRPAPRASEVALAYQALGVSKEATDAEVTKAYRKLMSQHHPDKLIAQGVPDDMLKIATEKTQEIQAAYEMICKSRGI
jgi:DnaJ like chaperone protein